MHDDDDVKSLSKENDEEEAEESPNETSNISIVHPTQNEIELLQQEVTDLKTKLKTEEVKYELLEVEKEKIIVEFDNYKTQVEQEKGEQNGNGDTETYKKLVEASKERKNTEYF